MDLRRYRFQTKKKTQLLGRIAEGGSLSPSIKLFFYRENRANQKTYGRGLGEWLHILTKMQHRAGK